MKPNCTHLVHLRRVLAWALVVAGGAAEPAAAQTTNTWTNATGGNWNAASNWTPGAPVSSTNTILQFTAGGGATYRATNNFAGTFLLNRLLLGSTSTNAIFLVGNALQFSAGSLGDPLLSQDGSGAVVISNAISLGTNLVVGGSGSGALTLNGVISGGFDLIKRGDYTLALGGANTFGNTNTSVIIDGGTLSINATARLGAAGRVVISSNAALQFTAGFTHSRPILLGAGGGRIDVTGANAVVQTGALSTNAETLTKSGTGIFQIQSTNSGRTGAVVVNGGILQLDNANAIGGNTGAQLITVNGGTLAWNNALTSSYAINLNGGRLAAVGGNRTFAGPVSVTAPGEISLADARTPATSRSLTFTGDFSGSGNLAVTAATAAATLVFTNTNFNYTGTMTLGSNVTAIIGYTNFFTTAPSTFVLNQGATLSMRHNGVRSNGVVTNRTNFSMVFSNSVVVNGNAVLDARRAQANLNADTNFSVLAGLTVNSNSTVTFSNLNNYRFRFTGPIVFNGTTTFHHTNNTYVELAGPVMDGTNVGTLIKSGAGTLFMTNLNPRTYSGGTLVLEGNLISHGGFNTNNTNFIDRPLGTGPVTLSGGLLTVRADTNIAPGNDITITHPDSSLIRVDRISATGGTGRTITFGGLNLQATNSFFLIGSNAYVARFTNPVVYAGALVVTNVGADLAFDSLLSNTAPTSNTLTKFGINRLFLTGMVNQPYTGGTFVNGGQVRVAGSTNVTTPLGTGPVVLNTGTALELRSDTNQVFGPGNGYAITLFGPATINVDRFSTNGGSNIFQLAAVNIGTNTLTVTSGNGSYLAINWPMTLNSNSILGGGNVQFNQPVTLGGSNTLTGTFRFLSNITMQGSQSINAPGTVVLNGFLNETAPGAALNKFGAGTLFLTNLVNNDFSGGTFVNGGAVQVAASGANNLPLGTNNVWLNNGGLNLRAPGSQVFGPGAGYTVTAAGNSTISVDRNAGANANGLLQINRLNHNGGVLTVSGGNTFNLRVDGPTMLGGLSTFNVTATRNLNPFSLLLAGPVSESVPGAVLRMAGGQSLGFTNHAGPTHTGGTVVDQGSVIWRPTNAPAGLYRFGTGPIRVGGGALNTFAFQVNLTTNYVFSNDFVASAAFASGGGLTNAGGGTLDFTGLVGSRPLITNFGSITLRGPLYITTGAAGNNGYNTTLSPLTFVGTATVANGNQPLVITGSGSGTGNRIVFNTAFTSDGPARNLLVTANNNSGVEFTGNNSGFAGRFDVLASFAGSNGRVLFADSNSLPAGGVNLGVGAAAALRTGFNNAGLSNAINRFTFGPNSSLGLTFSTALPLDFSPAGMNRDARIGSMDGFTGTLLAPVTPFADTFKLGGGGGTLAVNGTNILRDGVGPRRLSVNGISFVSPYGNGINAGTTTVAASNSFTGGTLVNGGVLNITTGRANTPLGTGLVETYGLVQATGGGSFASASGLGNNNAILMHPGSEVRLDNANTLNTNRFGDNAPLALNGSILRIIGRNVTNQLTTEQMGAVTFAAGGQITISGSASNGAVTALTLNSLDRSGTGTLYVNRALALGGSDQLYVTSAPATSNGMVAPYIVNNSEATFVNYGLTGFTNVIYSTNTLATPGPDDLILHTSNNAVSLTADATMYALRSGQSITAAGASNLTVRSGGVIFTGTFTNTGVNFIFGDGAPSEALVYVQGGATARLSNSTITASTITKFGDGVLRMETALAYANGWNINRGAVALGALGSNGLGQTTAGNFVNLNGGATLQFSATGSNITYTGGKITSLDNNNITADFGGQSDRIQSFASGLDLNANVSGALGSALFFRLSNSRNTFNLLGPLTLNADASLQLINTTFPITGGSNRLVLAGGLVGGGRTLDKYGSGTLVLTTDNSGTFTDGRINVQAGVLAVGHNGALGNGGSVASISPGAVLELTPSLVNFAPVASVSQLPGSAERWTGQFNRFVGLTEVETYSVPAGVHLQLANNFTAATNKTIRLNGGTIEAFQYLDDARAAVISLGRGYTIDLAADGFIGQSGVDIARSGVVFTNLARITESGGARSLTKIGLDAVVLGATNNSWTGGTHVRAGILRNGVDHALPASTWLAVTNFATYDLGGFNQRVAGLSGDGTITNSINVNRDLTVSNSAPSEFSGGIHGNISLLKKGTAPLTLSGAGSSTGSVQLFDGTLFVGGDSKFGLSPLGGSNTPVSILALTGDASLLTTGPFTVPQPVTSELFLTGSKIVGGATAHRSRYTGQLSLFDNATLTAAAGGRVDFEGVIRQSAAELGITKTGDGIVSLTASNEYSGGTTVNAGTLLVNNTSGSGTGLGAVTVNPGATLGGTGRITGPTFISESATLRPGDTVGRLRFDSTLSFDSLASVSFEIGGPLAGVSHDAVSVTNFVEFAGTLSLSLIDNHLPATNGLWTLMDFGASNGGTFNNAFNGVRLTTTDAFGSFKVNYTGSNLFLNSFQYTDSDGDGIYDAWAMRHFGLRNLLLGTNSTDRYGDYDGDGVNNRGEFMAGTIPTNSASVFHVSSVGIPGSDSFVVRFTTADETGFRTQVYSIQFSTDLANWTTVVAPVLTVPAPGFAQWIDDGSQTGGTPPLQLPTARFYRVLVE